MSCNSFKRNLESPYTVRKCLQSPRDAVEPISPPPLLTGRTPSDKTAFTDLNSLTKGEYCGNTKAYTRLALSTNTTVNGSLDHFNGANESDNLVKFNTPLDNPQSPMNVLATIALATSPTFTSQCSTPNLSRLSSEKTPKKRTFQNTSYKPIHREFDANSRPSKRARSEAPHPSHSPGSISRPLNSNSLSEVRAEHHLRLEGVKVKKRRNNDVQRTRSLSNDVANGEQISDAELLLDFSRGAKIPIPGESDDGTISTPGRAANLILSAQEEKHLRKAAASPVHEEIHNANSKILLDLRKDYVTQPNSDTKTPLGEHIQKNNDDGFPGLFSSSRSIGIRPDSIHSESEELELEDPIASRRQGLSRCYKSMTGRDLREKSTSRSGDEHTRGVELSEVKQQPLRVNLPDLLDHDLDKSFSTGSCVAKPNQYTKEGRAGSAPATATATTSRYLVPLRKARSKSGPAKAYETFKQASNRPTAACGATKRTSKQSTTTTVCVGCNLPSKSSSYAYDKWICCNGCKGWYHYYCAGFKSEREVRSIHKFYCERCESEFGRSTFVRKSGRAHAAVDYAGLNEGVLRTSDESPEHHYIRAMKDGKFKFNPDKFPRIRPELITAEFFEKCGGMTEPIVIPAIWNPRTSQNNCEAESTKWPFGGDFDIDVVADYGQDKLDMVIPHQLTVRQVAKFYGPEEKVEVIDVKSQEGEDKRWNMRKWVDYYEEDDEKVIRNVISLEVSASKLGRLIRRPRLVRELDLQDDVWPEEEISKGLYPKVQFYCLMSVADCYTDFHIDFGGSSVYYHILKGKKTFFFIPPTKQNLKKYEGWCLSESQNWTFLPEITSECYRVNLSAGDTMIIPSGWIHAVWTPENSLVIGGNFLTRLHYELQIRIAEIEKNTKVPRKFRYPHFQKIMWYTAIRYLEEDPLPSLIQDKLSNGETYERKRPIYEEFHKFGHNSDNGTDKYNSRYYSRSELDGLPELARYLFRTVMISFGSVEGISPEVKNAVTRSIPKAHGEPLDLIKTFAMWIAWKRGNEEIPEWAYPKFKTPVMTNAHSGKKLSVAALRRLEKQADQPSLRRNPSRILARQNVETMERISSAKIADKNSTYLQANSSSRYSPATCLQATDNHPPSNSGSACIPKGIVCDHTLASTSPNGKYLTPSKKKLCVTPMRDASNGASLCNRNYNSHNQMIPFTYEAVPLSYDIPMDDAILAESNPINILAAQRCELKANEGQNCDGIYSGTVSKKKISTPSKRGRGKACSDCRRSKRRCNHVESDTKNNKKFDNAHVSNGEATKKHESMATLSTSKVVKRKGTEKGFSPYKKTSPVEKDLRWTLADRNNNTRFMEPNKALNGSHYLAPLDTCILSRNEQKPSLPARTAQAKPKNGRVSTQSYQDIHKYIDYAEAPLSDSTTPETEILTVRSGNLSPSSNVSEKPGPATPSNHNGSHLEGSKPKGSDYTISECNSPKMVKRFASTVAVTHKPFYQNTPDVTKDFADVSCDFPFFLSESKDALKSKPDIEMYNSVNSSEDDSLRLARLLATSEFGLRRRI